MFTLRLRKPEPVARAFPVVGLTGPRCELCTKFEAADETCRRLDPAPSGVPRRAWPKMGRGGFCPLFDARATVSPQWLWKWWLDGYDIPKPPKP